MANNKVPIKKENPNAKAPEIEEILEVRDWSFKGYQGTETITLNGLNNINFESQEDYDLYKSKIEVAGKVYDVLMKFSQGRKTTNYLHTIVSIEGGRISLGFTSYIGQARTCLNEYILRHISNN